MYNLMFKTVQSVCTTRAKTKMFVGKIRGVTIGYTHQQTYVSPSTHKRHTATPQVARLSSTQLMYLLFGQLSTFSTNPIKTIKNIN